MGETDPLQVALQARGLYLNRFPSGVLNITAPGREMTEEDVRAFRALLPQFGYVEVSSWVATQGQSWLSGGVFAGISFRVREDDDHG